MALNFFGLPLGGALAANNPAMQQASTAQQQLTPYEPKQRTGFLNTLGRIGDIMAAIGGKSPLYAAFTQMEDQRDRDKAGRNALANFLAHPEDQLAFQRSLMFDPDRTLALRKDMQGEEYTLGEGQARFRGGKEIARGPGKKREIDGVVFDDATGQPLYESPYDKIISGPDGSFNVQERYGFGRGGGMPQFGGAPTGGALPRVNTPDEARRLAPGTRFIDADGKTRMVPGGGASNGTGVFR